MNGMVLTKEQIVDLIDKHIDDHEKRNDKIIEVLKVDNEMNRQRIIILDYDMEKITEKYNQLKKELEETKCWIKLHGVSQTPVKRKKTGPKS